MNAKSSRPVSAPDAHSGERFSYVRLLLVLVGSIFLAEVVAMVIIYRLPQEIPYQIRTLIDAGIMVVLIFPVLYFLSFRPLVLQIDQRRQAEEKAKAERTRFNNILETLPGYLVLLTPDYHVPFANHFFRERFGEAQGRRCYEYLFGRDQPCEICETYKVLKTMQPGRWEWTGPDGHIYDVYDFPFTDTDGSTLILEMGLDITEQKLAEGTVRQLSRIVEQTEDTVVVTNREGVIEYVNPSFERLTGYTKEEALGKTPRVIKSSLYDKEFYQNLWNTILAGEVFQSEIANRKKNGDLYHEVKTITPLRDMQGNITHFVATGKDITEHKLDEEKLRNAYDELEQRVQERTEELRVANSELEQEVMERKRAEETLRKANLRLQDQAEELDAQAEELKLQTEELRDANEQLSKSEATLQSILNAAQESIWLFSTDGIILTANTTALARMNMTAGQVIGRHSNMLMPADVAHLRQAYLNEVVETGQPVEFEDQRAGITFHHNFYPVKDANGHVTGAVAFSRDITERKQAEEALRQSEQRLRRAQEIAHLGSWELDLENNRLSWSDEVYRIFGLQPQEFGATYEAFIEAVHPEDRAAVDAAYSSSLKEGKDNYEIEHRVVRRKSGEIRTVHEKCEHFRDENGHIVRSVGMVHDITERKQMEEALRFSEEKFARAFANNPAAIAMTRLDDGLFMDVNDTWVALMGYNREEVIGHSARKLHIWPSAEAAARFTQELHEKGSLRGWEHEFFKKSGEVFVAQLSSQLLTVQNETWILSTLVDITERKRVQERGRQLNRTLKALNRSNQVMLRSRSETELLDEVCKIIVEDCGYAMVWIGFKEEDEAKSVRPVASAGFEAGYLENMKITWIDSERGRGPTGTAIRTGETRRCRNMLTDPQFAPWREQALQRGYASSIALPLKAPDNMLGAITIYSHQPDSFADEEEQLLKELAGDLAYGIESLRLRAAHAQAEEALHRSEALLNQTGEMAKVGGWELDVSSMTLLWSQETYRIHEVDPALQPNVETAINFYAPEAQPVISEAVSRAINEGEFYDLELPFITAAGKRIWIRTMGQPEFQDGKCVRLFGAFQDITERKRAEEALQNLNAELELRVQQRTKKLNSLNKKLLNEIKEREEVERQLRIRTTAMEAAANGIVITDPQGTIQWANPALIQISGYDSQELIGQSTHIFRSGQHDQAYYHQLWDTILAGQVWRGEITNRRKDGTLYIEEETITPVHDENGQIPHFIAVKQDITQRKQAEAQLAEHNIKLQALSIAEHEQRKFSESLAEAALAINKSTKLDEILPLILEQVKAGIPYQLAIIMMFDGESFYDAGHAGDERWSKDLTQVKNRFPLDDFPLLIKMRQSHQPVLISDTQKETDWMIVHGLEWSRSILCVPLLAENQVIGFLNLLAEQPDFFTIEMQNRLVAFAAHASVAIQNAWLFEQVRASSERLQSLSRRLVEIQENERLYIARELHDEAGQMLTSLMLDLVTLETQAHQPEVILKKVPEMEEALNAISENLHNVAMALRPASLDHLGLVPALHQYAESIAERSGLKVSFRAGNLQERLPANMETELYRIVQEALTNVMRHAHASQVDVVLTTRAHKLIVIVEDDGSGFDPEKVPDTGHLGLFGMRERAEMIGGQLVIESKPGKGTTVMVEVDYDSPVIDRG